MNLLNSTFCGPQNTFLVFIFYVYIYTAMYPRSWGHNLLVTDFLKTLYNAFLQ